MCHIGSKLCTLEIVNKYVNNNSQKNTTNSICKYCKYSKKNAFDKLIINHCSSLQKFGNFDCAIVNTLGEYIWILNYLLRQYQIVDKATGKKNRFKYVFRGLKNMEELNSALKRKKAISKEFDYIKKFEENGCMKLGQFNNAIDMAAAARHYGVTSRLLDWSTSPLVATLFALYEPCPEIQFENDKYYGLAVRNYNESCLTLHVLDIEEKYCNSPLNIQYRRMIEKYEELLKRKTILFQYLGEKISSIPKNLDFQDEAYKLCDYYDKKSGKIDTDISCKLKEAFTFVKNYFTNVHFNTNYVDINKKLQNMDIEIINKMIRRFLKKDVKIYIETNFSNERLRNQRGVFEIDDVNDLFSFKDILDKSINIKAPKIILIKKEARKEIIKYIDKLGINFYMLMDDPENTSKIINSTVDKKISFDSAIEYE